MNQKLYKLLFKNETIQKFLCNDLFEELKEQISLTNCLSKNNLNNKTREINYIKVQNTIALFLLNNKIYLNILNELFSEFTFNQLVTHLIACFVFYLSKINITYSNINIFTNKYSICYNKNNNLLFASFNN